MRTLKDEEAYIITQTLTYLRCLKGGKHDGDRSYASGLVRAFIASIGCFTDYGDIYKRLSGLEGQIQFPLKRRLP